MTKKISAWAMFVRAFVVTLFAGTTATNAQNSEMTDETAWEYAVSIGTSDAIRDYLRNFPTGAHLEEAVRLLLSLGDLSGTGNASLPSLQTAGDGQDLY